MPIDAAIAVIKAGIELIKGGLSATRKQRGNHKANQLTSAVFQELLKASPDLTSAEAKMKAVEATGAEPTAEIYRANAMLHAAKSYKTRPATTKARKLKTRVYSPGG